APRSRPVARVAEFTRTAKVRRPLPPLRDLSDCVRDLATVSIFRGGRSSTEPPTRADPAKALRVLPAADRHPQSCLAPKKQSPDHPDHQMRLSPTVYIVVCKHTSEPCLQHRA